MKSLSRYLVVSVVLLSAVAERQQDQDAVTDGIAGSRNKDQEPPNLVVG
jgi:hypothetical protein